MEIKDAGQEGNVAGSPPGSMATLGRCEGFC
jgi:hypothetical protein